MPPTCKHRTGQAHFSLAKLDTPRRDQRHFNRLPTRQPTPLFPSYHHAGKHGQRPLVSVRVCCGVATLQLDGGSLSALDSYSVTRPYPTLNTRTLPRGSSRGCQEQTPDVPPTAEKKTFASKTRLGEGILLFPDFLSSRKWVRSSCPAKTPGLEMQKVIK